jgi:truncated hemoglobin YjbI
MKRKEKPLTMDEAVEWLAALTDKMMAKYSPEERARRFRNAAKIIAAAKKRDRAKPSRSSRAASDRRRILARG